MQGNRFFCSFSLLILLLAVAFGHGRAHGGGGFVTTNGTGFVMNGRPFYSNGFNAYWLMYMASDPAGRSKVSSAFQQASSHGMKVVRTWAFSDGGHKALQCSPGSYDENMFQGLDFVISEARKYGVYLILSLVNNHEDFGGKRQYVRWARDEGRSTGSDDDFFQNDVVKSFYKNHVKTILTRNNTMTGMAYRDDPTIFAWELINEPRCQSDLSGRILQDWITEMAAYVKSIDSRHLLEVGAEGFYGDSIFGRKQFNPGGCEVGTDFIANNQIPEIDFATIHAYPDQWIPGSSEQAQLVFLQHWIQSHIGDADAVVRKPLVITEFGKSSRLSGYTVRKRDTMYRMVYNSIYASARSGGPCRGGLFWQLLIQGMDGFRDGYEIIFSECPLIENIISRQSRRTSSLISTPYTHQRREHFIQKQQQGSCK
ncbi:putative mannan endo-1,4-beta-mannosidase 9 [Elaeis guineensis]|uniref:mannan endo-1,4-beta-mannosidase n=1 Tax=Elaeis guineensis var. tenera TaxID=51953 RepID=A0A6I9QTL4_ELAGV|nr:putative mannan endo-1,4-beta-mannosidase 9 isoform X1 [Elaeis guineensis]